ncbi:hypothetical protein JAAARDRAFT_196500 [Jaapia argillacea MUCL 33604]|uniref:Uncharacterized protein n=1 Tax=Jaapia argillacea MUCL 33604 TaxID=933084 RepID=A0A067PTI2_9AGAM|nr:hypothetical protein JAAARDRAFT_196500 [Jaapia argillacea MUCL 33604]
MPPQDSNLVINFICRILLICLTSIHLGIAICSHVRGTLIHVHNQLLQLVITTTHTTYRPIVVPAIHFQFDENGYISSFLGDLYNEEDFERPWNAAPTPPPPAAPSVGTPDFATTPPRSPSPPSPCEQEFLRRLTEIRQHRPELDPLDVLRHRLNALNTTLDYPDTRGNTPDYENYETAEPSEYFSPGDSDDEDEPDEDSERPVTPLAQFIGARAGHRRAPSIDVESSPEIPTSRPPGEPSPTTPPTPTRIPLPQTPLTVPFSTLTPLLPPSAQLPPVMAAIQMTDVQFQQLLDTLRGSNSKVEKIAAPGYYDGDKKEYDDWRDNIVAYIDANTKAYGTDKAKFLYVTSLLRGAASTWRKHIRTQWTQHEGLLTAEKAKAAPDAAEVARLEQVLTWD